MREIRLAQISIFEKYSEHQVGVQLKTLSALLDKHSDFLPLIMKDFTDESTKAVGRNGLSVESIFRCLLLKKQFGLSYELLAFHLSDSMSYRAFARLPDNFMPKKSSLQATIRQIKSETLEKIHKILSLNWLESGEISLDQIRIDSTVVASHITPPSDSQLLNDAIRVLSRHLAKSREKTGVKIRFTDKRKAAKSLAFQIFNAKHAVKEALYLEILKAANVVLKQVDRSLIQVEATGQPTTSTQKWIGDVEHYRHLLLKIMNQTVRRVIHKEKVSASEKIVSLFEEHTDIIVKGFRDVQYGHKINLATETKGFITYLSIESGNPADSERFMPILNDHQKNYHQVPGEVVCDGCYASQDNVLAGRALGIKRVVFSKRVGLSYHAMGIKRKTFERLRCFRAGVEGNISELKRTFGANKAKWKGHDGFKAFVWSSVISYNLVRLARSSPG